MLKKRKTYTVAVVGATGAVGEEMVATLEQRVFPVEKLRLFASERSEGQTLHYDGRDVPVEILKSDSFKGIDLVFFSAGPELSSTWVPRAVKAGCVVIDNSGRWSMDFEVPLVVPEVNVHDLKKHKGIIANPNCSTIQMVIVLKPIHDAASIKRVVVTTFQSVSGAGKKALEELMQQTIDVLNFRPLEIQAFPHQIAFNCIPHIDSFLDNGYTQEEMKMVDELKKIMGDATIRITATAVRVPVFRCHAESLNIETERKITADEVRGILAGAPGVIVYDAPEKDLYPLAIDVADKDETYVGRIREDASIDNGINLWTVTDNLRKGAALNAVQIAEKLIEMA